MAMRDWFRRSRSAPRESPQNLIDHDSVWHGAKPVHSVAVGSADAAMRLATVWACVSKLSEQVASFPVRVLEVVDERGQPRRLDRRDHPLWYLLARRPNTIQSSFEWRQLLVQHLALRGVHYSQIVRDRARRPIELWPLNPDCVTVQIEDKSRTTGHRLIYHVSTDDGGKVAIPQEDILHVRGLYSDLIHPISVIGHQRLLFETNNALGMHEHSTFAINGAMPGGMVDVGSLNEKQQERLLRTLNDRHAGPANTGRWIAKPRGVSIDPIEISYQDAQFLELTKASRLDIMSVFGVPPEILGFTEHSKYASAQAAGQFFVATTLRPMLERIENAFSRDLLGRDQARRYDVEMDATALLRGSPAQETEMHVKRVQGGLESPNEGRLALGLDRKDEPGADQLYIQMNQDPVSAVSTSGEEDMSGDGMNARADAIAAGALLEMVKGDEDAA